MEIHYTYFELYRDQLVPFLDLPSYYQLRLVSFGIRSKFKTLEEYSKNRGHQISAKEFCEYLRLDNYVRGIFLSSFKTRDFLSPRGNLLIFLKRGVDKWPIHFENSRQLIVPVCSLLFDIRPFMDLAWNYYIKYSEGYSVHPLYEYMNIMRDKHNLGDPAPLESLSHKYLEATAEVISSGVGGNVEEFDSIRLNILSISNIIYQLVGNNSFPSVMGEIQRKRWDWATQGMGAR